MALNDKNIVITPNKGQASDPKIAFTAADAGSSSTITLNVYTGTNGTLSFEGSAGQLFSISNSFAGTIFSVNDVSGIPSIEVLDTGQIKLAQYGGYVSILGTTSATSTSTGVLQVAGGVGIGGNLYVGGTIYGLTSVSGVITTATNLAGGSAGQFAYQTGAGATAFISTSNIYVGRAVVADTATTATNAAVAYSTIAAHTAGTGLSGTTFNGSTAVTWTLNTATLMAAAVTATSAAVAYALANTSTTYVGRAVIADSASGSSAQVNTVQQTANATYYPTFVDANNTSAAAELVYTTSSFTINPATGNVGIGTASPASKLHVVGDIQQDNATYIKGKLAAGTATRLFGLNVSDSLYIGSIDANHTGGTLFFKNGAEQMRIDANNNVGIGITAPTSKLHVSGDARITGITTVTDTTAATSTNTGALQVTGGAGIGGNLYAGLDGYFNTTRVGRGAGSIVSNTVLGNGALDSNTTGNNNIAVGYLALNSNSTGQFNTVVGSGANSISSAGQYNITVGYNAGNAITTGTSNTIIGSVSGTAGMTGTVIVAAGTIERFRIDSVGNMGVGTTTPSALLDVNGTVGVRSSTNATSTSTGALQVAGGAGIGGNLYVGGTTTAQMLNYSLKTNARGSISGNQTIDLTLGNFVTATAAGVITWTFSNPTASPNASGFILELINGGAFTQNWPLSVDWPGGTAPTLTVSGVDILVFITDDAGTTWRGVASMLDSK